MEQTEKSKETLRENEPGPYSAASFQEVVMLPIAAGAPIRTTFSYQRNKQVAAALMQWNKSGPAIASPS